MLSTELSLHYLRMVCDIVHRTCRALVEEHLMSKYVNLPSEERLKEIIEEFKGFSQVL